MKKRRKFTERIIACVLATLMVVGAVPVDFVGLGAKEVKAAEEKSYSFETKNLIAAAQGTYGDGDTISAGADNYFTIYASSKTKIDSSSKTFVDGYESGQRLNLGGAADVSTPKNVVSFKTNGKAKVKIWWVEGGDDYREMAIYNSSGVEVKKTSEGASAAKNDAIISELELEEAGIYYIGGDKNNNYIFKISVTDTIGSGGTTVERKDWSEVDLPVLGTPTQDNSNIIVPFDMVIGDDGADKITVTMTNEAGEIIDSKNYAVETTSASVTFKPDKSGKYYFSITAIRDGETDKIGENRKDINYLYPLSKAIIGSAYSKGNGSVALEWSAVKEATSYDVEYTSDNSTCERVSAGSNTETVISGLTVGKKYTFRIIANRNAESTTSDTVEATATSEAQQKWGFVTYGNGASSSKDSFTGNANDGSVTVKSASGKIVPASFDGLSFYYTQVPASQNFTLRAKVSVDTWTFSNGQEGFGLMATDKLGGSGWNNSYMAIATKVEYYWDSATGTVTTDSTAQKVTHKNGIGAQEKVGITNDNIVKIEANDTDTIKNYFKSSMYPLEQRYPDAGNVIGKSTNVPANTISNPISEMYMTIQKNNTGYFVTYESIDGNYKITKKYYEPKALEQLDSEYVYAGFFASRNATVTFSDISFTTIDSNDDAPSEVRPVEKIAVNTNVQSTTATGTSYYEFLFSANCDGSLRIVDENGTIVANNVKVKADTLVKPANVSLKSGKNDYKLYFTPDSNYKPDEYSEMESYETKLINFSVTYKQYGTEGQAIWVAPNGSGSGSKSDPMSIYEAVKYVQPGQQIILKSGTYKLSSTLKTARGVDGTSSKMIYMISDPAGNGRPVLDFQGACAGMIIGGNYWYFKGFDVTNSADGQKGIQVSGKNCVLDNINAYHNGNTGIQISRLNTTDTYAEWPSNNLILNCTSYGNADRGYEDADGFAAKLTVGDGNVFDGCIAHHNADDGWDLYAKVQSGSIGSVTIRNCVAYANGYLEDGTNAGNGNGFKMGGDSMPGAHKLINSVAFNNKAKGIDSNSCPDIKVENSTSFNNESYNVAFYTNTAANTDYYANGIISFRTENLSVGENIKPIGSQNKDNIYGDTNYYWNELDKKSSNKSGAVVDESWFVNLDTKNIPSRNADGTINMNGLLVLTDNAAEGVGARISGTASNNITQLPSVSGSGSSGSSDSELSDDSDSDSESDSPDESDNSNPASEIVWNSPSEEVDILKPEEIPGATVTNIEGIDFAELVEVSEGAEKVIAAINAEGQVKSGADIIESSEQVASVVINELNKESASVVTTFAKEDTSITKEVFDKLKETGKTLSIGVVDKDGKVNSIVTIDGSQLTGKSVNFNLKITVDAKDNKVERVADRAGIKDSSYTIVDFEYSGNLPGTLKAAVNVSKKFADGTRVALYYYNSKKGVLENQYQIATVSNGFAEFAIDHCSEYVLVDVSAAEGTITTSALGSPKTADSNSIIFWLMLMCAAVLVLFGIQAPRADGKKRA